MIGAGNISHQLSYAFSNIDNIELTQLYNHQETSIAKKLSQYYTLNLATSISALNKEADIYFICVKDEAITPIAKQLSQLKLNGLAVHTSGSVDLSSINSDSLNTGVYYPLQTFSKTDTVDWALTPVLIEASNKKSLAILKNLAKQKSCIVKTITSEERIKIHLAAVFACNFTNSLYGVAFDLIEKSTLKKNAQLLKPLITHAFEKMIQTSPRLAQTGPAKRKDTSTMNKHLKLLNNDPLLKNVYKTMSQLIITQQDSK